MKDLIHIRADVPADALGPIMIFLRDKGAQGLVTALPDAGPRRASRARSKAGQGIDWVREQREREERRAQLVELLRKAPKPLTVTAIAETLDASPKAVKISLGFMVRNGLIKADGKGYAASYYMPKQLAGPKKAGAPKKPKQRSKAKRPASNGHAAPADTASV